MLTLCATLRFFQKPINYYARHSELTYERHSFSCLASRRKKCKVTHPIVQTRKEETAACNKTIQNKNQRGE